MTPRQAESGPRPILPTERINVRRQLELLDIVVSLGGPEMLPVTLSAAGAGLAVGEATVQSAQGFMRQNDLLCPSRGMLSATPEGFRLSELRRTDSARARLYLRDLWLDAWFTRSAVKLLRCSPEEPAVLAQRLSRHLTKTAERGMHLVEWLDYALVVEADDDGRMRLVGAHAEPPPPAPETAPPAAAPFLATAEEISGLPDGQFFAVMQAYQTLLTSRASSTPPTAPA
ncbi:hypothetical protein NJO91_19450 [Streptomyces microflavus]|uniref:hypothetical protein n=1 Tax=Streptomyces TaxID=1883 RepID=UPI000F54F701|nr:MULTISPECIES: hypothetical protein [Streptomyces]MDX2405288.1 hypothetical protein [Streptomyces microflavus]RPK82131.1 hypothetical protein EES46_27750 [Streptomyces sp. ADI98-10]